MSLTSNEEEEYAALMESMYGVEPLKGFIDRLSPRYPSPAHVDPLRRVFERMVRGQRVQVLLDMPPRHVKTTTILHGLAYLARYAPGLENAYVSAAGNFAKDRSSQVQALANLAGVPTYGPADNWRTRQGGRLKAIGLGGQYVGTGTTGLQVIDDPYPTVKEALSANYREDVWTWYHGVAMNRREPGSSVIISHTRWHVDDLIGRLLQEEGHEWERISLPAIFDFNEEAADRILKLRAGATFTDGWEPTLEEVGRALWPGYYSIEELLRFTRSKYFWWALFMGQPRPLGSNLFMQSTLFKLADFDIEGCRACIMVDPAASESTAADHSAIGVFAMRGYGLATKMYVLHVERHQKPVPWVVKRLVELQKARRLLIGAEAVAGFKAVPQMLRDINPRLRVIEVETTSDKFIRSQPVSGAWNTGNVLVPEDADWEVDVYLREMHKVTGVDDPEDDQMDITAHAWNLLYRATPSDDRQRVEESLAPFG